MVGPTDCVDVIGTGTLGLLAVLLARLRGRSVDVIGGRIALVGLPGKTSTGADQSAIALKILTLHGILHGLDYYGTVVDPLRLRRVNPAPVVAAVFGPEQADGVSARRLTPSSRGTPQVGLAGGRDDVRGQCRCDARVAG